MRFAQPPVPALRSSVLRFPAVRRSALLAGAACVLAGSALAGATYSYDSLGRIISVRYDDGKQIVYKYDAAGNRTQHIVSATTVNRKPVTAGDAVTLTEDQNSLTLNPRTNDSDPDGNPLTLFSVGNGVYGTAALSGGNTTVTYSSTYKRNATDKVVYTITDGQGMDASGEVTVTLANLDPVAVNDVASTAKNTFVFSFDPRVNDSDPGGDAFTITSKSTPSHGVLTIVNGGTLLAYTPTANYTGPDSFTYTVTDVDGGTATATVNVTVTHGTLPPVAVNDSRTTLTNTAFTTDPRTNDSDDSGTITITAKTNGTKGTVVINGGTSVTYTPNTGQTGADSFTYTITDLDGMTATATVNVTIQNANSPPVAVNDTVDLVGTYEAGGVNGTQPTATFDPRVNDNDPDNNALTITNVTQPTNGSASTNGTSVTITHNNVCLTAVQTQVGSVTYTISDGLGGTATATIGSTVTCEIQN